MLFDTLSAEEFSETKAFLNLSNHVSWSQELQKYLSYEAKFFSKCLKFKVDFKNAVKMQLNDFGFTDNCFTDLGFTDNYYENTRNRQSACKQAVL